MTHCGVSYYYLHYILWFELTNPDSEGTDDNEAKPPAVEVASSLPETKRITAVRPSWKVGPGSPRASVYRDSSATISGFAAAASAPHHSTREASATVTASTASPMIHAREPAATVSTPRLSSAPSSSSDHTTGGSPPIPSPSLPVFAPPVSVVLPPPNTDDSAEESKTANIAMATSPPSVHPMISPRGRDAPPPPLLPRRLKSFAELPPSPSLTSSAEGVRPTPTPRKKLPPTPPPAIPRRPDTVEKDATTPVSSTPAPVSESAENNNSAHAESASAGETANGADPSQKEPTKPESDSGDQQGMIWEFVWFCILREGAHIT